MQVQLLDLAWSHMKNLFLTLPLRLCLLIIWWIAYFMVGLSTAWVRPRIPGKAKRLGNPSNWQDGGFRISGLLLPWANDRVWALGKCYTSGKNCLHQRAIRIGEECLKTQNFMGVARLISRLLWERASRMGNRTRLVT